MRVRLIALLLGLAALLAPAHAADKFPSEPVHWVVGFAAGGPNDIVARIMGDGCPAISASNSSSRTAPARAA